MNENAKRETLNDEPAGANAGPDLAFSVQRSALPSALPPPSTPILEAIVALHLNADERTAVLALVGVRTLGDLATAVGQGGVKDKALADKLQRALGIEAPAPKVEPSVTRHGERTQD